MLSVIVDWPAAAIVCMARRTPGICSSPAQQSRATRQAVSATNWSVVDAVFMVVAGQKRPACSLHGFSACFGCWVLRMLRMMPCQHAVSEFD